jgi:predicted phage terminase large subunit-like protein
LVLSPAYMFVDLASTDGPKSDDSVIIVAKHGTDLVQYVVDCRGDKWLPAALAQNVIELALRYRPAKIYLEKTASCTYFAEYLRTIARQLNVFLPLDFIPVSNKADAKNIRISALQGQMKSGRLKFFVGLQRWEKIVEQFTQFPGDPHDDYPDTTALMSQTFNGIGLAQPYRQSNHNPIFLMIEDQERERQNIFKPQEITDGNEGFFGFE